MAMLHRACVQLYTVLADVEDSDRAVSRGKRKQRTASQEKVKRAQSPHLVDENNEDTSTASKEPKAASSSSSSRRKARLVEDEKLARQLAEEEKEKARLQQDEDEKSAELARQLAEEEEEDEDAEKKDKKKTSASKKGKQQTSSSSSARRKARLQEAEDAKLARQLAAEEKMEAEAEEKKAKAEEKKAKAEEKKAQAEAKKGKQQPSARPRRNANKRSAEIAEKLAEAAKKAVVEKKPAEDQPAAPAESEWQIIEAGGGGNCLYYSIYRSAQGAGLLRRVLECLGAPLDLEGKPYREQSTRFCDWMRGWLAMQFPMPDSEAMRFWERLHTVHTVEQTGEDLQDTQKSDATLAELAPLTAAEKRAAAEGRKETATMVLDFAATDAPDWLKSILERDGNGKRPMFDDEQYNSAEKFATEYAQIVADTERREFAGQVEYATIREALARCKMALCNMRGDAKDQKKDAGHCEQNFGPGFDTLYVHNVRTYHYKAIVKKTEGRRRRR